MYRSYNIDQIATRDLLIYFLFFKLKKLTQVTHFFDANYLIKNLTQSTKLMTYAYPVDPNLFYDTLGMERQIRF